MSRQSELADLSRLVEVDANSVTITGTLTAPDVLFADTSDELTAGFTSAVHDIGNSGTGTVTVSLTEESLQTLTITGSFTLAPPASGSGTVIILATTDNTGGYTLTSSGFTKVNGEWDNAADGVHLFTIRKVDSTSILNIEEVA